VLVRLVPLQWGKKKKKNKKSTNSNFGFHIGFHIIRYASRIELFGALADITVTTSYRGATQILLKYDRSGFLRFFNLYDKS
jgi:hypothetical protein